MIENTQQLQDKTINCFYMLVELKNNKRALLKQKSRHIWLLKDMDGIDPTSKIGLILSDYQVKRQDLAKLKLKILVASDEYINERLEEGSQKLITFSFN